MKSGLFAAAGAVVLTMAAGAALADEAEAPTDLEELVVTGEKSERSLQDTVTSVAVVTARRIADENIQALSDILDRTPNVSQAYGASNFTIRGIANDRVSGAGSGGLATIYVDGAALPERAVFGGPLQMWDVSQVEILRGPQSTLQGRNALAGAVIVRSQDPTWDWSLHARATADDQGGRALAIAGGGPIVADQLAFRLAVEDKSADGFIRNVTRGGDANPADDLTVRGKLLFTPAGAPDLSVLATLTHSEHEGGYVFSYARTDVPDYFKNRVDASDAPNTASTDVDILTVEARYALTPRLSVSSITSWNWVDYDGRFDSDMTSESLSYGRYWEARDTVSQELRANYSGERLSGVAGLYVSRRDGPTNSASLTNVPLPKSSLASAVVSLTGMTQASANALVDQYALVMPVIPVDYTSEAPETIETAAFFVDAEFRATPRLTVLGGFRVDHEENTSQTTSTAKFVGTYPNPADFGALGPVVAGLNQAVAGQVAQAGATAPTSTRKFDAFLPKLGVKYAWTQDLSTSFVVQRGYRSGGSSINTARSTVNPYDPEYTWNYEFSLRSVWLDGALTLNANAFYLDWTDQQVLVNLGLNAYDSQTVNAGKSHLYGGEIELDHRVGPHFRWYASAGYTKTEFDDFQTDVGSTYFSLAGSEFAYAPHWTGALGGSWRGDSGLFASVNLSFRSSALDKVGAAQRNVDARTLVNTKIGYEHDRWSVYVAAANLFDEASVQYLRESDSVALLNDPRVVSLVLETRW